ncbi:hypothetical protein [Diplocloster hominis]|uniref:hypothetical protein n=1 Tax=Diplocloster hominis TaxID=3079010 RepID=UPI0031B9E2BF
MDAGRGADVGGRIALDGPLTGVPLGAVSCWTGGLPLVWVSLPLLAGAGGGVWGCSRRPGPFVSPWECGGLALVSAK